MYVLYIVNDIFYIVLKGLIFFIFFRDHFSPHTVLASLASLNSIEFHALYRSSVKERNAVLRCSHPTPPRRRASQFRKTRRWAVSLRFQYLRRLINPPQSKRKILRSETMQANTNPFFAASCGPPSNNKPKEIGPPCTTS